MYKHYDSGRYCSYSAIEFAKDPCFLEWRLLATPQACHFWERFLIDHPECSNEVERATEICAALRFNDFPITSEEFAAQADAVRQATTGIAQPEVCQTAMPLRGRLARRLISAVAAVAAIAVVCIRLSHKEQSDTLLTSVMSEAMASKYYEIPCAGGNQVRLVMGDSSSVMLPDDADVAYDKKGNVVVNGHQQTAIADAGKSRPQTINKLVVPHGRRSSLVLSDGTKVWINAGSTLEFPSVLDGSERRITLWGEAYFEVARDESRPFRIQTNRFGVTVLGTKFDISAYDDDPSQSVVVASGAVEVKTGPEITRTLKPSDMLTIAGGNVGVKKVDVYQYISWKDNLMCLYNEPMSGVLTRLSRYYDMPIKVIGLADRINITGKLVLLDDINSVLDNIAVISNTKCELINNSIVISKQ